MLVRLRLSVPDQPGSLGRVTSAIGAAGADIERVEVLDSESGRATDDVFVRVLDDAVLARVVDHLSGLRGVSVIGQQRPAPPTTGHAELELVRQLVTRPAHVLKTLVDGVPSAVGADWAAMISFAEGGVFAAVIAISARCPSEEAVRIAPPLRLRPLEFPPGESGHGAVVPGGGVPGYCGAALVPVTGTRLGLVLVREHGPAVHRAELWRLGQLGEIAGAVLGQSRPLARSLVRDADALAQRGAPVSH